MTRFDETVQLQRPDGTAFPVRRVMPEDDAAMQCNAAGVLVLDADALVDRLVDLGYFVVVATGLRNVDEVSLALLSLKELARGKLGVIGGGLAIEAAVELPQLDAVVHIDGGIPTTPKIDRIRAPIVIHRASRGRASTEEDCKELRHRARPSLVPVNWYSYPTSNDRFVLAPQGEEETEHATIAWDRIRDFLSAELVGEASGGI